MVHFLGEITHEELFNTDGQFLDHAMPIDESGEMVGTIVESSPTWLEFEYSVDGLARRVLLAKQPVMNNVSWNDLARGGIAIDDPELEHQPGSIEDPRATIVDSQGRRYIVRLPSCGQSTMADLSEWNLLIGGVHVGDKDFRFRRHGWISNPYSDAELHVGYNGTLSWCQDAWRDERVTRGYFNVSRFHASDADWRGERVHWRPVLEAITPPAPSPKTKSWAHQGPTQLSPDGRVTYFGIVSHRAVFGDVEDFLGLGPMISGFQIGRNKTDWLRFRIDDMELLVAQRPVRHSISWDELARAGLAGGEASWIWSGWRGYRQNRIVTDQYGNRYWVRLLRCGSHTLDHASEWNSLMGAVHVGDGDFRPSPEGLYGWISEPMDDSSLNLGSVVGGSTWCSNRIRIKGRSYMVNRGFHTVSRHHATRPDFTGWGFGWRPVLELLE